MGLAASRLSRLRGQRDGIGPPRPAAQVAASGGRRGAAARTGRGVRGRAPRIMGASCAPGLGPGALGLRPLHKQRYANLGRGPLELTARAGRSRHRGTPLLPPLTPIGHAAHAPNALSAAPRNSTSRPDPKKCDLEPDRRSG